MPSNQQMAEWQAKPDAAPKHVRKRLPKYTPEPESGSSEYRGGGGRAAPAAERPSEKPTRKPKGERRSDPAGVVFNQREGGIDWPDVHWPNVSLPDLKPSLTNARKLNQHVATMGADVADSLFHAIGGIDFGADKKGDYLSELEPRGGRAASGGPAAEGDKHMTVEDTIMDMVNAHAGGRGGYAAEANAEKAAADREHGARLRQEALDKQQRADVLGVTTGALSTAPDMLAEMTDEKYNSLTPRQRAAVDFNTALSTAVRKDTHRQAEYKKDMTPAQVKTYNTQVSDIFGPDGGSDLRAPETLDLLRQLKIEDTNADLDQYLQLKVAISGKDLKNLNNITDMKPASIVPFAGEHSMDKKEVQGQLVDATLELTQYLEKGDKLIQDFQQSAAANRLEDLKSIGVQLGLHEGQAAPGYGNTKMDGWYERRYNDLIDKRSANERPALLSNFLSQIQGWGGNPDDFINYVDTRLKNSEFYGEQVGDNPEGKYSSAERIRAALGMEN